MAIPIILSTGSISGAGTAGQGRNNLVTSETVTLSDTEPANSGAVYLWEFEDIPIGSSTTIVNPTSATPTFVPDVTGTYRTRCLVNSTDFDVECLAVPLPNSGTRIPSFQERLEYDGGGNAKGWHEAMTFALRAFDVGGGGNNTLDRAYDQGGAGAGRAIDAANGAVTITSSAADGNNILELGKTPAGSQPGSLISGTNNATCTGDMVLLNNDGSGNATSILQGGAGAAISVSLDGASTASQAIVVTETAVARTTPMVDITRNAAATGHALLITNPGSGDSINVASGISRFNGNVVLARTKTLDLSGDNGETIHSPSDGFIQVKVDGLLVIQSASTTTTIFASNTKAMEFVNDGTKTTLSTEPGDYFRFGDAATANFINSEDDVLITGASEVVGIFYCRNALRMGNDYTARYGASSDFQVGWHTTGTNPRAALGLGASNVLIISEVGDQAQDWGNAAETNPMLWIHAADGTDLTKRLTLQHVGTGAELTSGSGTFSIYTTGGEAIRWSTAIRTLAGHRGTAGDPAYSFIGDTITGVWSPGAGRLAVSSGGGKSIEWNTSSQMICSSDLSSPGVIAVETDFETGITSTTANSLTILTANKAHFQSTFTPSSSIDHTWTQFGGSGGTPKFMEWIAGNTTSMTASTEAIDIDFDLERVISWAQGDFALQRAFVIRQPTYAFTATSTITEAATVHIVGEPLEGSNSTILSSYALQIASGNLKMGISQQLILDDDNDTTILCTADDDLSIIVGNNAAFNLETISGATEFNYTQGDATTGSPQMWDINAGAHTTLTASTEAIDINIDLSRTVQFNTGALALQRAFVIRKPTYAFVGTSTITETATVYIEGAPALGANALFTNAYTFWVDDGVTRLDSGVALGGGSTPTLGTIGATGPATAAQNEWIEIHTQNGARFVPAWA